MVIINSSYTIHKSSKNNHRLDLAEFYSADGDKLHTETLLEGEYNVSWPTRITNMIDPNYVNKARPVKIIYGAHIKMGFGPACWIYAYDKNGNCIMHQAQRERVNNLDELADFKLKNLYSYGVDWNWIKDNKEKIIFEIEDMPETKCNLL